MIYLFIIPRIYGIVDLTNDVYSPAILYLELIRNFPTIALMTSRHDDVTRLSLDLSREPCLESGTILEYLLLRKPLLASLRRCHTRYWLKLAHQPVLTPQSLARDLPRRAGPHAYLRQHLVYTHQLVFTRYLVFTRRLVFAYYLVFAQYLVRILHLF
jgi:hypothetical protein